MTREECKNLVLKILVDLRFVKPDTICEENLDKPLTGGVFGMDGKNLLRLYLEVENALGTRLNPEYALHYGMYTLNGFIDGVMKSMSEA